MFDIARTLSCCRGAKASILADRETWRINSSGGRISYTLSGKHIPILRLPPDSGQHLSWASLAYQKHVFLRRSTCLWLVSAQTSSWGKTHTHLCTKTHTQTDKDLAEKMWKLPSGSRFVCHRVTYWIRGLTNQLTSWSQIPGKRKKKPARKEAKWQRQC